jgi:lipopolysaccharide/colanic/teichoic acid biosynthesis glycosyltransferase
MGIIEKQKISLSFRQRVIKRLFDIVFSIVGLFLFGWIIFIAWILAAIDTRSNGFFFQERVGRGGKLFRVIKVKTMSDVQQFQSSVTVSGDPRVTWLGAFFRKTKIDELPQLVNVFCGDMSFVGPRPDVPGFADTLVGDKRAVLSIRPGITGPASLKYRAEEHLLANLDDPESFNRYVIWTDKVQINLNYIANWSFVGDIKYIFKTLIF